MNAEGPFEYGSNNFLVPEEESGLGNAGNLCATKSFLHQEDGRAT